MDNKDNRDSKGNNKIMDKDNKIKVASKAVSKATNNLKIKVGKTKMVKINNNKVKPKMDNKDNKGNNPTNSKVSS